MVRCGSWIIAVDEAAVDMAAVDATAGDPAAADPDSLILVDAADRAVGQLSKSRCHEGKGVLHRAFSLLIFNAAGDLLIQQRSPAKRLWPMYWSNSCCSHPRSGEDMESATRRRLREELERMAHAAQGPQPIPIRTLVRDPKTGIYRPK